MSDCQNKLFRLPLLAFPFLMFFSLRVFSRENTSAVVYVKLPRSLASDSIRLFFWEHAIGCATIENLPAEKEISILADKSGYCKFSIRDMRCPGYISIYPAKSGFIYSFIQYYLLEPGDSVGMKIDSSSYTSERNGYMGVEGEYAYIDGNYKYTISFSGRGAGKFSCRYIADRRHAWRPIVSPILHNDGTFNAQQFDNVTLHESLSILRNMRTTMSDLAYRILEADFTAIGYSRILLQLEYELQNSTESVRQSFFDGFPENIRKVILDSNYLMQYSEMVGNISCRLPLLVFQKATIANMYSARWSAESKIDRYRGVVMNMTKMSKGNLRLKSMVLYLKMNSNRTELVRSLFGNGMISPAGGYWAHLLKGIFDDLSVGSVVMDFALPDSLGKIVHLHDFKNKLVFIDFWFSGCYGCRVFYDKTLRSVERYFRDSADVVFVSISPDINTMLWKKSVRSDLYTSPYAINLYTGGKGTTDEVIRYFDVEAYPYQVLLDGTGKIRMLDGLRVPADSLEHIITRNLER